MKSLQAEEGVPRGHTGRTKSERLQEKVANEDSLQFETNELVADIVVVTIWLRARPLFLCADLASAAVTITNSSIAHLPTSESGLRPSLS